jgi:hypothetical protein
MLWLKLSHEASIIAATERAEKRIIDFFIARNQSAGVLRKPFGGSNRMKTNGSEDILLSDRKDISPIAALALPITGSMAVRIEAELSAFTIILKLTEGSSAVP